MQVTSIWGIPIFMLLVSLCAPASARGDLVKFKHGAKKKCVIVEKDEEWITFLSSFGEIKMPLRRVESIEYESDEVNDALREKWTQDRRPSEREEKPETKDAEKEPHARRAYSVNIKKRRIVLGARTADVASAQAVASFLIKDMGMTEGSRLFHVSVTSYKSTSADISPADFHVISTNGARFDPKPLKGYNDLSATVGRRKTASGHVAFPTSAELETMVVRSDLAEFELDLETGDFTTRSGFF